MPRLIVSIDGVIVKEVQLTKDRSTLGRRPYNDIVIDNLAVSGEHAAIVMQGGETSIEDLGSTNGTYVNGHSIKRQKLEHDDVIEVGKYKVRFVEGAGEGISAPGALGTAVVPSVAMGLDSSATIPVDIEARGPRIRVLNGSAAGRIMELTKVVTTVGKPGVSVASITRRTQGFDLAMVEGEHVPSVNGVTLDGGPIRLKNRDQIDLGGVRLEFIEA
ncbi:FHA domain-containing protein [Ottowia sp.]|uniref:FHA domain-containing protein n=1 Tax=Ottowia sp. TaxID=1898956 RepID=UPI00261D037A|nr:FHA domain-containing protein [Ottowia sp.]